VIQGINGEEILQEMNLTCHPLESAMCDLIIFYSTQAERM
jgi:hypothetical protein